MNPVKYLFLVGAILCGAIAMLSMLMSGQGAIWDWLPWLGFIPAYILLNFVIEDYGVGTAYTLWISAIILIIVTFVILFGASWGELLSDSQYLAAGLVFLGFIGLMLTQPRKE